MNIRINRKNAAITRVMAVVLALIIIIAAVGSAVGYLYYTGVFSKPKLVVFIASSLTKVVENMTAEFEQTNNCQLVVSSAGSSSLYIQINARSPCDVFMSADIKWNKKLNDTGNLYNNYYTNFTKNSLCIILAEGNPKNIASLVDLIKPGVRLSIGDLTIPAGSYTNTTVWKIDSTWGNISSSKYDSSGAYVNYNATFFAPNGNIKNYAPSVETVVGDISLNSGSYDAGIVYISDWKYGNMTGAKVQFLAIPAAVNTFGTYGISVVSQATQTALAQKFMDYWLSVQGQTLLRKFGFGS